MLKVELRQYRDRGDPKVGRAIRLSVWEAMGEVARRAGRSKPALYRRWFGGWR